jgi:hypothetical protein
MTEEWQAALTTRRKVGGTMRIRICLMHCWVMSLSRIECLSTLGDITGSLENCGCVPPVGR